MTKRLVVCCDGTWNTPDRIDRGQVCPSNVAKLALALAPTDNRGKLQLLFYDKGVGTYNKGVSGGVLGQLLGGAIGWGLSRHILDCYRFLVGSYEPGDEIFLFGFSRGAYTARSLAGFIRNAGLLRREHIALIPDGYELYRRRDQQSHPTALESELFRKSFAHETRIRFVGVWDTVGSLGIPLAQLGFLNRRWQFHDVKLSSLVDHAYHAVAIDERREWFGPTLWQQQEEARKQGQVMEQVWFAGVHSNIGGGYQDTGLSDLTLQWMVAKAESCGLAIDQPRLRDQMKPDYRGVLRDSKTGVYALLPDAVRSIGEGVNAHEDVHDSAKRRLYDTELCYRPANLEQFLKKQRNHHDDVTGTQAPGDGARRG